MQSALLIIIGILLFELIVFIHELGHFVSAKLSGITVTEFAMGMGPVLFKFQKGETQYSLRLLPIGGFCSMPGEDGDSDDPHAFNKAKLWKRTIVLVAGAFMNIVLALVISCVITSQSEAFYVPVLKDVAEDNTAHQVGLQPGDTIVEANGFSVSTYQDLSFGFSITKNEKLNLKYKRDGQIHTLTDIPFKGLLGISVETVENSFMVTEVFENTPAQRFGLQAGDKIVEVNSVPITNQQDYDSARLQRNDGRMQLKYERDGEVYTLNNVPLGRTLGIDVEIVKNSFGATIEHTFKNTFSTFKIIWYSLFGIVNGNTQFSDFSGPVGMVSAVSEVVGEELKTSFWDALSSLLSIMAFLSLNLGVFNLLPFPALDGGRVVFLAIEGIRRKPMNPKIEIAVNFVGFACLMLLLAAVTFKDVWQLFLPK